MFALNDASWQHWRVCERVLLYNTILLPFKGSYIGSSSLEGIGERREKSAALFHFISPSIQKKVSLLFLPSCQKTMAVMDLLLLPSSHHVVVRVQWPPLVSTPLVPSVYMGTLAYCMRCKS